MPLWKPKPPSTYDLPEGYWIFNVDVYGNMGAPQAEGRVPAVYDLGEGNEDNDKVRYLVCNVANPDLPHTGFFRQMWPVLLAMAACGVLLPAGMHFIKRVETKPKKQIYKAKK